ncbi:tail fiber assembly protein [Xenorhabdus griffiniae]|uniref:tail fiber assembly protein n=1 Tax=Xenorhabdus griffiniae TaxID=351672 RepID=UPI0023594186|nr:tail fiber assembly protein [Xenorhabdus griffiniae]MDC9606111.1 tail fiber assembly protein [Xenorhabdus griffiniae]
MKYITEIIPATFDDAGFATVNGWVKVYRAHKDTGEYLGVDMERTFIGVSVAAGAYLDEPELPESDDIAICRSLDGQSWVQVADHRGKTGYHTQSREPRQIQQLGELPPEITLLKPVTDFDVWDGKQWNTDTIARNQYQTRQAEEHRQALLHHAEDRIRQLERRKRLGMATKQDMTLLQEWEIYSVKLTDIDLFVIPDIDWPEQPE